jgi:hypothetical protein
VPHCLRRPRRLALVPDWLHALYLCTTASTAARLVPRSGTNRGLSSILVLLMFCCTPAPLPPAADAYCSSPPLSSTLCADGAHFTLAATAVQRVNAVRCPAGLPSLKAREISQRDSAQVELESEECRSLSGGRGGRSGSGQNDRPNYWRGDASGASQRGEMRSKPPWSPQRGSSNGGG